jgi:hypothetical protein
MKTEINKLTFIDQFTETNNTIHIVYKNLCYRLTLKEEEITSDIGISPYDKWTGYVELFNVPSSKRLMGSRIRPVDGFFTRKEAIKHYQKIVTNIAYLENIFVRELKSKEKRKSLSKQILQLTPKN